MTRLDPLRRNDCTDAQAEVWDSIVGSRGSTLDLADPTGGLIGPFNAMVTRPHVGGPMAQLGHAVRFSGSLEPRLLEIAICTVGARWKSEFEFWAHRRLAVAAGVAESALDALAAGELPEFDRDDERLVHAWAHALVTTGHPSEELHADLVATIGTDALIDLTVTCGYYCQISFVLNAFAVALPDGVAPTWPSS